MHRFTGFSGWLEIFRGGEQTDSAGRTRTWTAEELDQIIGNYSSDDPAPAVIGHPKTDDPAYGWVDQLKREGKTLLAKFREVEPQFAEMVKQGRFKKRSVSIAKNRDGEFFLRHVGWLGAAKPAVQGLAHPTFADDAAEVFEFEAPVDWRTPNFLKRVVQNLRDLTISQFGIETADRFFPSYMADEVGDLADQARRDPDPDAPDFAADFSQHDHGDKTVPKRNQDKPSGDDPQTFSQEDVDSAVEQALQAERDKHASDLAKERRERRRQEYVAFVDDLGAPPAVTAGMADFMLQLADGEDSQFEFTAGEGDKAEKKKQSPLAWFQAHVGQLKGRWDHLFQEQADSDPDVVDGDDAEAISRKALEFQKSEADAGRTISVSQAVQHVMKGAQQ